VTCAHITAEDVPCGHPAVATWWHPILGDWPLCKRHDRWAQRAKVEEWVREDMTDPGA
jgi:hypothetical protein